MNESDFVLLSRAVSLSRAYPTALLWAVPEDLQVMYATPNSADLLGTDAAVIGQSLPVLCPALVGIEPSLQQIALGQHPPLILEHIHYGTRYLSVSLYAAPTGNEPPGVLMLVEDTTAAAQILQELNQSRNELRLLKTQLERANEQLTQANRFKGLAIATASHEIGGRLAVILGYTDLLLTEENLDNPHQMLEFIRWSANSLSMSLKHLISLDQIERGQIELQRAPLDLPPFLQKLWEIYLTPLSSDFEITLNLPSHPLQIMADRVRLEQICYNLFSNALKYTPIGGSITLTLTDDGQNACIVLQNSGAGISEQDQAALFNPYFRTSDSQRRKKDGSGLGLYIVKQLVEAHGGKIEVESQPNQFTRFSVWLPL
ncbi:MAG: hypothetical protein OHK0052_06310 [Anaerolineales bacterium]